MKFKNYIETGSGIKDTSTSPGTAGQVLSSTVTGTSWIDPDTLEAAASKLVVISCKNVSGAQILKGTPVYQSGTVGATDVIEVEPADATISTGYLPAIGILQTTLNNNGFGNVVITGEFLNYSTADIPTDRPGGDPFTGDTVYLAVGGGLTCIKPTGAGNAIQNMGLIGKVSGGNSGSITVASIMRANDVPNLPEGRIWIGDGNTIVSDTVYVDEPNNSLIVNGTTLQTTESLSIIGSGYFSDKISIGTAASTTPINNSYTMNLLDLNSAIAFGDNSQTTQNVIVGEYGSTDTDQLWLHGKNGTIFSHDGDVNEAISIAGVIDNVGKFGIGTTNPAFKLDVANGGIGVPRDSTGITFVNFSTLGSSIKSNTSSDLIFNTRLGSSPYTESERMRILNNGNVGIGTISPVAKLEVEGGDHLLQVSSLSATGSPYVSFNQAGARRSFIQHNDSGDYLKLASEYGGINFFTGTGGTETQKMTILSGGNVGINTTNPTSKLTSFTSAAGPIAIENRAAILGINTSTDTTYANSIGVMGKVSTSNGKAIYGNAITNSGWGGYFDGKGYFSSNVGIGVINALSGIGSTRVLKVESTGNSEVNVDHSDGGTSSDIGLFSFSRNGDHLAHMKATHDGTTNSAFMSFHTQQTGGSFSNASSNERMRITSIGNVGIGTTSPSSKLQVNGGVQLANDTTTASAGKAGTFRYRTSGNNSYVDMCMQTGSTTWTWINIVQNNW